MHVETWEKAFQTQRSEDKSLVYKNLVSQSDKKIMSN